MNLTGTRKVTAPDGTRWKIRPRWRVGPDVKLRRKRKKRDGDSSWFDIGDMGGADDVLGAIFFVLVLGVVIVLAVFFVWPLLALAIELLIAVVLVAAGAIARVAFGKPWTVEASAANGAGALRYSVRGYGAMRRVCAQLAERIAAGDRDPAITGAERI